MSVSIGALTQQQAVGATKTDQKIISDMEEEIARLQAELEHWRGSAGGARAIERANKAEAYVAQLLDELEAERARSEALVVSRDISERGRVELRDRVAQLEAENLTILGRIAKMVNASATYGHQLGCSSAEDDGSGCDCILSVPGVRQ